MSVARRPRTDADADAHDVPTLQCRGVAKRHGGHEVLADLTFAVRAGEIFGLLGPNGAGKTTAISILSGLARAEAGEVLVLGRPLTTRSVSLRAAIGLVPQEVALWEAMTARENLQFFGRLQGLRGARLRARVDWALAMAAIDDAANRNVATYSGGMKRRVNIAVGLVHEPRLVLLDEPTVGIDAHSRRHILEVVRSLADEGTTVVLTSHQLDDAQEVCDVVGVLDGGRLACCGPPEQLIADRGLMSVARLDVIGDVHALAEKLLADERVGTVAERDGKLEVRGGAGDELVPAIFDACDAVAAKVLHLQLSEPTLEDLFIDVTGKALRD